MKTGRALFISSGIFALVIAVAYWIVAREIAGTFLLGFLALALAFLATYIYVAERKADYWGDQQDATMADAAGQEIGTYSIRSPLPFWTAVAVCSVVLGIILSPAFAILGLLAVLAFGAAFIVQSR